MAETRFDGTCLCGAAVAARSSVRFDRPAGGKLGIVECPTCKPEVHGATETAPSKSTELRVQIQGIAFAKPDGSFTVARVLLDPNTAPPEDSPLLPDVPFEVKGALGKVRTSDLIDVFGHFKKDAQRGWQFHVLRALPVVAGTDQALVVYLSKFPQVGRVRAQKILRALGSREAVLDALANDPKRLTVVEGITDDRAEAIAKDYQETADLRESALYLASLQLGENLTAQILEEFGADTKVILAEDPYQLMSLPGVGFKRADEIAMRMGGIGQDDPRRVAAATLVLLEEVEGEGHTWAREIDLYTI